MKSSIKIILTVLSVIVIATSLYERSTHGSASTSLVFGSVFSFFYLAVNYIKVN